MYVYMRLNRSTDPHRAIYPHPIRTHPLSTHIPTHKKTGLLRRRHAPALQPLRPRGGRPQGGGGLWRGLTLPEGRVRARGDSRGALGGLRVGASYTHVCMYPSSHPNHTPTLPSKTAPHLRARPLPGSEAPRPALRHEFRARAPPGQRAGQLQQL